MDMRKISVEPKISTENIRKSSLRAGLVLKEHFTDYKYNFETGKQIFLLAKVRGEIDIGKNLSNALYGIVSSKFKSVSMGSNINEIDDVDIYFVPNIKSFTYSPPYTGLSSHSASLELEIEIYGRDGKLQHRINVKQEGSRSVFNQFALKTNYDMACSAVNEAINNALKEFTDKLNEYY
ncbi:MAG TPA: hypothetical protein DD713_04005 [Nitrospiraceae bacterium]|nr:hypothetical protein [Nitrospiraceae bacterium]